MEKNGITLAVYFFTKSLVLHVGHACADLEGKEVGKGEGMGRIPPGKKKILNLHSTMHIYNYKKYASDPLPGKMI